MKFEPVGNRLLRSDEDKLRDALLDSVLGDYIKTGVAREVYYHAANPDWVVKVEAHRPTLYNPYNMGNSSNLDEWKVWETADTLKECDASDIADWLAPCIWISGCGRVLIQQGTDPIPDKLLPVKIPKPLAKYGDHKSQNWGLLDGKPVCHDYSSFRKYVKMRDTKLVSCSW